MAGKMPALQDVAIAGKMPALQQNEKCWTALVAFVHQLLGRNRTQRDCPAFNRKKRFPGSV
jgi:hypothetical protein